MAYLWDPRTASNKIMDSHLSSSSPLLWSTVFFGSSLCVSCTYCRHSSSHPSPAFTTSSHRQQNPSEPMTAEEQWSERLQPVWALLMRDSWPIKPIQNYFFTACALNFMFVMEAWKSAESSCLLNLYPQPIHILTQRELLDVVEELQLFLKGSTADYLCSKQLFSWFQWVIIAFNRNHVRQ